MRRSREGWTRVRFGDVVRLSTERCTDPLAQGIERYVGLEHLEPGDLRIRSWGNVADGVTFTNRFRPGQVLFGKRRAYQRKVAVAEFDGICSSDIYVFEPADDRLLPGLLPFICQTTGFFEHALKTSAGSLSPRTNWSSLADYEFALPSLEKQQQIGAACDLLRASIEACCDTLRIASATRDSLIMHLYEHGTHSETRAMTALGMLPLSWHALPLETRYDVQLGKKLSPTAALNGDPRPYLRNENVDWNRLDLSDVKEMCFTAEERSKLELQPQDIVACEGRHVGKAAMWNGEVSGMCCQNTLHRLRAHGPEEHPPYMLHCLRYFHISQRFVVDTAASTIPHLTLERFRRMMFPFPPMDEQKRIAACVDTMDTSMAQLERRLQTTKEILTRKSENWFR
jgi:type I restriction enzyme S subunit